MPFPLPEESGEFSEERLPAGLDMLSFRTSGFRDFTWGQGNDGMSHSPLASDRRRIGLQSVGGTVTVTVTGCVWRAHKLVLYFMSAGLQLRSTEPRLTVSRVCGRADRR